MAHRSRGGRKHPAKRQVNRLPHLRSLRLEPLEDRALLSIIYSANMDTAPSGWTSSGQWAFGHPTGQGGTSHGNPDPSNGCTGSNAYGVNLSGDYSTTVGGPYYVATQAINCSGYTGVKLDFMRWLNTDYPSYAYATIDVSNNGSTWTNIYTNPGSTAVTDNAWQHLTYDIGAVADNKSTVYIRWGYQIGSSAYAYSGWNIDDVSVTGTPSGATNLLYLGVTDTNSFESYNPATGVLTQIKTSFGQTNSLDFSPAGVLYGVSGSNLYTIDTATGNATFAATLNLGGTAIAPTGISFAPDGTLYVFEWSNRTGTWKNWLHRGNATTGNLTLIGEISGLTTLYCIEYAGTTLYGGYDAGLYSISTTTAAATLIGTSTNANDMDYGADGVMRGTDWSSDQVNQINLTNSSMTLIATLPRSAWGIASAPGTSDTTPPTVDSLTPADNVTGVAVSTNLVINFGENVQKGTGNIVIKKSSDNSVVETIAVTSAQVTIAADVATIDPSSTLLASTGYYVQVASGAFEDLAGNDWVGISDTTSWNFTTAAAANNDNFANRIDLGSVSSVTTTGSNAGYTGETGEPTQGGDSNINSAWWSWTAPSNGSLTINTNGSGFDTYLTLATGSAVNSLTVLEQDDDDGDGSCSLIGPRSVIAGVQYQISVDGYHAYTGSITLNVSFTPTGDTTPPTVDSFTPADNATGVAVGTNLVINFSENVQKGTGNIVIKKSSDNSVVETIAVTSAQVTIAADVATIDPSSTWLASTGYYVQVASGAFEDLAGNDYAGISDTTTWNFTTASSAGSWTQTTQAEFASDILSNTVATTVSGDGQVILTSGAGSEITGRIANPSFESGTYPAPTSWTGASQGSNVSEYWWNTPYGSMPTNGSYYEVMYTNNNYTVSTGDYEAISQSVDLTNVATIKFDVSLYAPATWLDRIKARVLIDGVEKWSLTSAIAGVFIDQSINGLSYSGSHELSLRMDVVTGGTYGAQWVMFDNLRTYSASGYASAGSAISTAISPSSLQSWSTLVFNKSTPTGTTLTVDVLPATGSTPISGYTNVSSGTSLSGINVSTYPTIRLRANLSTTNSSVTPSLSDWTVNWQTTTNTPPAISLPGGALNYIENTAATVIDSGATTSDADSTDFNTGTLTVDYSANGSVDDRLAIQNQGTGAGQIGVSGSNVTYGGTTIGTFTGGSGTTALVVTFNASSTPAAAQALMRNITYANVSDNPSTAARTVRFVLTDGDGGTSAAATKTINVTAVNDAPVISLPGGALNYIENAAATVIDSGATASDADSTDFNTGMLTVDYSANGSVDDRLAIRNQGTGAGQIGVSGSNVTYGGTTIGTFTGGSGTTPLVITLNASSTPTSAQALMRNITYANVSDNPSTAARTVRFVLTDGDGGTSAAATKTINVTAVNDAPVISLPGGALNYIENAAATVIDSGATASDADSTDFNIGTLTVDYSANGSVDDRLAIQNQGTGAGQIGVSGSSVTYGGTTIGTFTGGSGTTPLVITLNANSTPTSAQTLMRNITYANVSDHPSTATRTVRFVLTDGDGGTGTAATKSINVTAVNDAPAGTDKTVTMAENGTYTFAVADFGFMDPNDSPANAFNRVKVMAIPGTGNLALNGVAVTAGQFINVSDIAANKLAFAPVLHTNGSPYTNFTFQVEDDGGTANGGVNLDPDPNAMTINVTAAPTPTIYYVNDGSTTHDLWCMALGNDANSGLTPSAPKATVQDVLNDYTLRPGDEVRIDTGYYTLTSDIVVGGDDAGDSTNPLTFMASPYGVIINRNESSNGNVWSLSSPYVTLTTAVDTLYPSWAQSWMQITGGYDGIYLDGFSNQVTRCDITANRGYEIYFRPNGTNVTIENCVVRGGDTGICNYWGGATVRNCTVYGYTNNGISVWNPTVLENNTIVADGAARTALFVGYSISDLTASDYNNLYAINGARVAYNYDSSTAYPTLAAWQSASARDAHSISTDPLFANPASGDFHVRSAGGRYDPSLGFSAFECRGMDLRRDQQPLD